MVKDRVAVQDPVSMDRVMVEAVQARDSKVIRAIKTTRVVTTSRIIREMSNSRVIRATRSS